MKKFIALTLVLMLVAAMFAGCGGSGGDKLIRVWVGEESVEFYQTVCNRPDASITIVEE